MNPKILYIDDDEGMVDIVRIALKQQGYQVLSAYDGNEGLQIAEEHLPALIFMDVMMPIMDGIEATRRLKANPKTAHIPVIGLTASTTNREAALAAGMTAYLSKPLPADVLIETLKDLAPAPTAKLTDSGSKRVLIAEDHADLSYIFSRTLKKRGYEVAVAVDGLEALRLLEEHRPHLLILDVNMPNLSGLDVLKMIRADESQRHLKVIVVTGNMLAAQSPEAEYADLFLAKPISIHDLVSFVNRLIQ